MIREQKEQILQKKLENLEQLSDIAIGILFDFFKDAVEITEAEFSEQ